MKMISNFHPPRPGDSALYYCINCKKSFWAIVPENKFPSIFFKKHTRIKCPDCKRPGILDPKVEY